MQASCVFTAVTLVPLKENFHLTKIKIEFALTLKIVTLTLWVRVVFLFFWASLVLTVACETCMLWRYCFLH